MNLPKDCMEFLTQNNLSQYEEFFFNLGVASLVDFFEVVSSDLKTHLKPLEERRFFKAISALKSGNEDKKKEESKDVQDEESKDVQDEESKDVQDEESKDVQDRENKNEQCFPDICINNPQDNKQPADISDRERIHGEQSHQNPDQQETVSQKSDKSPKGSSPFTISRKTYMNAAEKGIKLWTDFQIKTAVGLEKKRRQYYNMKVEELCSVPKIKKTWTKTEISGAADTAWTLKKTALLQVEQSYIFTLLQGQKALKQKESTVRKNLDEMLLNHKKLEDLDKTLKDLFEKDKSSGKIKEIEEEMKYVMRKLKNAQEALRKSLQERLFQLGEEKSKINKDFEEMPLSVELEDYLNSTVTVSTNRDSDSDESQPTLKKKKTDDV